VEKFTDAGNPSLTPESERRRWGLEGNAGGGDRDPVFIEHSDRQALRSLCPMRENREHGEGGNQQEASAHIGMRLLSRKSVRSAYTEKAVSKEHTGSGVS